MIGSGSWFTRNKILPGIYIQLTSDKNTIMVDENKTPEDIPSNVIRLVDKYGVKIKSIDNNYLIVFV